MKIFFFQILPRKELKTKKFNSWAWITQLSWCQKLLAPLYCQLCLNCCMICWVFPYP
jgi:hypothetical protein